MIAALLLAATVAHPFHAAAKVPPVAATERAFAAMAQTKGQWTAFRAFAAPDAIMLIDGPQPAAPFLAGRKDPPLSVMWWPGRTVTSCDGTLALSTGPWRRGDKAGRFFTIWRHDAAGWRWIYDGGSDATAEEMSQGMIAGDEPAAKNGGICHAPPPPPDPSPALAGGASTDGSLRWRLDKAGEHYRLRVFFSVGMGWSTEADAIVG